MNNTRSDKWQQLINLMHTADSLQQELLADQDETASYEFHTQLNNIADEFECFAADEERNAFLNISG